MKTSDPLKNIVSIVFGRTIELLLSFIAITILIRYLGSSNYGIFASTIALLGIVSKFIDLGFSQIIFREYSSNSNKINTINSALIVRIFLLIIFLCSYNIYASFFQLERVEVILTNILAINIVISAKFVNIRDLLEIPFKSKLRMDIVMLATFVDALALLIFIFLAIHNNLNLIEISILYTMANLPGFVLLIYLVLKSKMIRFKIEFKNLKWLLKQSFPLWGAGLLLVLFVQLDIVLLKIFRSSEDAGLFSAAVRIGVPLSILPISVITTIFPLIINNRVNNIKLSRSIISFSFKILTILLAFAALTITFKSKAILSLIYGTEFATESISLIFIFWSFFFFYLSQLIQNLLTILGKQENNLYYSIILITIFLIVIFFTIVDFGGIGAGFARLISSIIGFTFLIYVILKTEFSFKILNPRVLVSIISITAAGYLINFLSLLYFIPFFTIVTIMIMYSFKYFTYDEFLIINKLLKEPKWLKIFQQK